MRSSASARGGRETKGRPSPAAEQLPSTIYAQLRELAERFMRGESPGHTLQPTALVHEAFLRVAGRREALALSATHLRALFAQAMRHILVDHARRKRANKRGGQRIRVAFDEKLISGSADEDLLDLDDVLVRLAKLDPTQAQLVELRIFGGMTVSEAAEELGVSKRTAEREWTAARAWLRRELALADTQ
jgi:RNA polymerase sigma factor (TIGR02999 family)